MPSNKSTPEELQKAQEEALNTPPNNEPLPELEEIRAKDNTALTEDERKVLTEHAEELTEEERTKFGIKTNPVTPEPEEDEENKMELSAILDKEKEDLTEEELTYLESHAEELTDEQKKNYGFEVKNPVNNPPPIEERYRQSTIEAQVLNSKQRKFNDTVEAAANLPEPSEEELRIEYPDWDMMDDTSKKMAKKSLMNERRFSMVVGAVQEGKKTDEWVKKVDDFIVTTSTNKEFARLAGKEDEFKSFCMKPSRRGVDLEDLAKAFLHDTTDTPTPRRRGSLLESGSGGGAIAPENKNTFDDKTVATLRTKDHKTYLRLVREGKIKIEI